MNDCFDEIDGGGIATIFSHADRQVIPPQQLKLRTSADDIWPARMERSVERKTLAGIASWGSVF